MAGDKAKDITWQFDRRTDGAADYAADRAAGAVTFAITLLSG
jgi:hypothetical protein